MNHPDMKRLETIGKALDESNIYIRPHPVNEFMIQFVDWDSDNVVYECTLAAKTMKDFSSGSADSIQHKGFKG